MINDYASLQSAVASWLARADLTGQIPDLIQMAELRIQDDIEAVDQLVTVSFTPSTGEYGLPSDFDEVVSLSYNSGGIYTPIFPLTIADGQRMDTAALPVGYFIDAVPAPLYPDLPPTLSLRIVGGSDQECQMTYKKSFPALSVTNTANWLLLQRPNIYLYATLLEAAPFLQDDARIQVWAAGYQTAMEAFNRKGMSKRYGANSRQRVDFHAP